MGIKDFHYLAVFNRWGQQVFYSTDPAKGWDGMVGGQPHLHAYALNRHGYPSKRRAGEMVARTFIFC